jgi:hypothetical protein
MSSKDSLGKWCFIDEHIERRLEQMEVDIFDELLSVC